MKKNGLAVFKMEREGFKITLKTPEAARIAAVTAAAAPVGSVSTTTLPAGISTSGEATADQVKENGGNLKEITSPMVGTFYSSSSPDAAPYVSVGQEVTPDTVVCIIEAMKVMNEIKAEVAGVIAEVCADNGKPVQFGQALFRVK